MSCTLLSALPILKRHPMNRGEDLRDLLIDACARPISDRHPIELGEDLWDILLAASGLQKSIQLDGQRMHRKNQSPPRIKAWHQTHFPSLLLPFSLLIILGWRFYLPAALFPILENALLHISLALAARSDFRVLDKIVNSKQTFVLATLGAYLGSNTWLS